MKIEDLGVYPTDEGANYLNTQYLLSNTYYSIPNTQYLIPTTGVRYPRRGERVKRLHLATLLLLSLLLLVALSGCATREVIVVVTATPESGAAAATPRTTTGGEAGVPLGDTTVPLPPKPAATGEAAAVAPTPASTTGTLGSATTPPPPSLGRIAYMGPFGQDGPFQVFVANADGSGLRFPSEAFSEAYFPSLSPDGSLVALTANSGQGDVDILVMDVAGGEPTNLTSKPGQDLQPVWSPDGSQIAFISEREGGNLDIWLMGADGSNPRRLVSTPGEDQLGSWSPDGSRIVYSNTDEIGESLWIVDVASSESTRLTESTGGTDSGPAWSPNGDTIAFYSSADASTGPQIFTIQPDGSNRQQLTTSSIPVIFPVWSPDGKWLAYSQVAGNNQFALVALDLESQTVHPIPGAQGLATSWRAASEPLTEEGISQGPRQAGVEIDPAVLESAYRRGSPDAPIKIVEFSDYQCPFCQRWVNTTLPNLEPYIADGTVELDFRGLSAEHPPAGPRRRRGGALRGRARGRRCLLEDARRALPEPEQLERAAGARAPLRGGSGRGGAGWRGAAKLRRERALPGRGGCRVWRRVYASV